MIAMILTMIMITEPAKIIKYNYNIIKNYDNNDEVENHNNDDNANGNNN